jgi:hypothetical protein
VDESPRSMREREKRGTEAAREVQHAHTRATGTWLR